MPSHLVQQFFLRHGIGPSRVLVAASGGFDSTALLLVLSGLRDAGFEAVAVHVNHHLRGEESEADEAYVRTLCQRLGVPLHTFDGPLAPEEVKRSGIEAAARRVREHLLLEARADLGARFIATGHQQNDQAETVLMRILTGTGIAGLQAIHPVRQDGFVRPLLEVPRAEIELFLARLGESPRADRMNRDPRFLRTQVRDLLAQLEPLWVARIAALAGPARELWRSVERRLDAVDASETTSTETRLASWPRDPFLRRALLHRHIRRLASGTRDVGERDLERMERHLVSSGGRMSVAGGLELVSHPAGPLLRQRRIPSTAPVFEVPVALEQPVTLPDGRTLRVVPGDGSDGRCGGDGPAPLAPLTQSFQLPAGSAPSFLARCRRAGDRLRPLGARGRRKLKEILIDRKVPAEGRDAIPLLVWEEHIVWVAGVTLEHEFRLRDEPGDRYTATLWPPLP